jgi:N-acetylglucosamine kinase-like BadF-type ATPase
VPTRFALLRERQDTRLNGSALARLYLGVDGGQSSTTALIADETGAVLGRGSGGPCNHVTGAEAVEKFNRVIGACLAEACQQAGLERDTIRFAAACLGFSGGAEDKRVLAESLIRSDRYAITHDAEIALTGATAGEPGIIVIAGTGSMAFGRNSRGETARAGGWGYIYGDEGGAFDIVRQALRAALRAEEGWGPATSLLPKLLAAANARTANTLLHLFYAPEYPRSKVASLAPLIDEAARSGDEVARQVLHNAGVQLAELVRGVYTHLFKDDEHVPVAPVGGVFGSRTVRTTLRDQILQDIGCPVIEPRWSPVTGALLQALRLGSSDKLPHGMTLDRK